MDFIVRTFAFFFATYLLSLAFHFIHFGIHQERIEIEQLGRGHAHELAADTPLHKYLKHSHGARESEDLSGLSSQVAYGEEEEKELHAKLVCEGSSDGSEQDMVYWHKPTAEDDDWVSPWKPVQQKVATPQNNSKYGAGSSGKEGGDSSRLLSYPHRERQYVTFESDNGGWNNVRMALEAIFVFARATGRTVVMPPDEAFYFPDPGVDKKDYFQHTNGYDDFFPLDEMRERLGPDSVISMKEFLEAEAYPGHLGKKPPVPRAKMEDPEQGLHGRKLRDYVRSLASLKTTPPASASAANATTNKKASGGGGGIGPGGEKLSEHPINDNPAFFMPKFKEGGRIGCLAFPAKPGDPELKSTQVSNQKANAKVVADGLDPALVQRLSAFAAGREVQPLAGSFLNAKVVHFAAWPKAGYRVLMHFYTLFFFADPAMERRMKRFVRDHFRYHDKVWCAAHRVTALVRRDATEHYAKVVNSKLNSKLELGEQAGDGGSGGGSGGVAFSNKRALQGGSFSTFHIRHGEFQFKVVRLGGDEIVANTRDLLVEGELVYIATDEKDKASFFEPLREAGFELRFLDDYFEAAQLGALQSNMLGMVDTLVASQGRHFIGTWFSTFSGYITRLRGYARHSHTSPHRRKNGSPNSSSSADDGNDSFYFYLKKKFAMQSREPPSDPFYTREWPAAWEDIDG